MRNVREDEKKKKIQTERPGSDKQKPSWAGIKGMDNNRMRPGKEGDQGVRMDARTCSRSTERCRREKCRESGWMREDERG